MAGTAHDIRAGVGEGFVNSLIRDMAHDIGHDGLQLADGTALALKITPAVLIHQAVIFTVVVPHRAGAVFQDIFLKHFLPVSPGGGVGKVCEHTLAAPPCSDTGFIAAAGLYKHAFGFHLIQLRMNQEDAGLDVRGHGYASLFHLSKEFPGVLEALFIPGKDAALDAFVRFHGAVAGGKLETVNRYLLFPGGVDEIQDSVIAVIIQLRIVHGGSQVSKRIPGKHG